MTVDLEQRLRALAERAPTAAPVPDLWRRGRRRQARRLLAGTAASVVLAAASGLGLTAAWREATAVPQPGGDSSGSALPDQVFMPGAWLPGTDESGPIGPLALVVRGEQRSPWGGSRMGPVGVSAATGEYRFLDLPGYDEATGADQLDGALSPDGRLLAYWYAGRPSAAPARGPDGELPIVGVAVYDTLTGDVERLPIPTVHGLMVDRLVWSREALFVAAGQFVDTAANAARGDALRVWHPGQDGWSDLAGSRTVTVLGSAPTGVVVSDRSWIEVLAEDGSRHRIARAAAFTSTPIPSPDGSLVAGIVDPTPAEYDGSPQRLAIANARTLERRFVPQVRVGEVVGWRDASHVVVATSASSGALIDYASVDIDTGETTRLLTREWGIGGSMPVASELWSVPVREVDRPDWPADPRVFAGLSAGGVLGVAMLGLTWWRRRRVGA